MRQGWAGLGWAALWMRSGNSLNLLLHTLHDGSCCVQAAAITSQHEDAADAAEGALAALSAGFELEEAASRRSTAAPPSQYVMAGV